MKKLLIIFALFMMAYPVSATLSAPTSWGSGYKIYGKYWDCMGEPCILNGTMTSSNAIVWVKGSTYYSESSAGNLYSSTNGTDVFNVTISNMTNGGLLHIKNGSYTACINVTQDNMVVEGEGWGTRISPCSFNDTAIRYSGDYGELRSLLVIGNGSVRGWGIDFNGTTRMQASNLKVQDMGGSIKIVGIGTTAHAGQYSNIFAFNATDPTKQNVLLASGSFDSQFSNAWIGNGTYIGLRIESGNNRFENIHVWNNASAAALDSVSIRSSDNQFTNCYIESGQDGVDIFGTVATPADNNSFVNCKFYNNQQSGIKIGTANFTKVIGSNFVNNNLATGFSDIILQSANNSIIQGNSVESANGITYGGSNNNNGVSNNWGVAPFYFGALTGTNKPTIPFGAGDWYYNTTSKALNIWNGATWQYANGTYVNSY